LEKHRISNDSFSLRSRMDKSLQRLPLLIHPIPDRMWHPGRDMVNKQSPTTKTTTSRLPPFGFRNLIFSINPLKTLDQLQTQSGMLHVNTVLANFVKTLQYPLLELERSMAALVEIASLKESPSGENGRVMPSDDPVQELVSQEIRVGNLEHRRMTISVRKIDTESTRIRSKLHQK